jgi:hypothetical protein
MERGRTNFYLTSRDVTIPIRYWGIGIGIGIGIGRFWYWYMGEGLLVPHLKTQTQYFEKPIMDSDSSTPKTLNQTLQKTVVFLK